MTTREGADPSSRYGTLWGPGKIEGMRVLRVENNPDSAASKLANPADYVGSVKLSCEVGAV